MKTKLSIQLNIQVPEMWECADDLPDLTEEQFQFYMKELAMEDVSSFIEDIKLFDVIKFTRTLN